jgi:hypothetical protein
MMTREKLLNEILVRLGEVIDLLDSGEAAPEDNSIYHLITEAYVNAEDELNNILWAKIT